MYCQKNHYALPSYTCTSPDNAVGYVATVTVSGAEYKSSVQLNKRVAEGDAAQNALKALGALSLSGQGSVQSVGVSVPKQVSSSAPTVTASSSESAFRHTWCVFMHVYSCNLPIELTEGNICVFGLCTCFHLVQRF